MDTPPFSLCIDLPTPEATAAFARAIEPGLAAGDCLLLSGPVGAGKSHFARALIDARLTRLGRPEDIPSPTFTLVQVYDGGDCEIWHADLYRLTSGEELDELGLSDAFDEAICLIEWPDRLDGAAPPDALRLEFAPGPHAEARQLSIAPPAPRWQAALEAGQAAAARVVAQQQLVQGAGWGDAVAEPLAGDASTRRYTRLRRDGATAILMDAPPESCGPLAPFTRMTQWLRAQGYSAPDILAEDTRHGFLLLEDLGAGLLAQQLDADSAAEPAAYREITGFLADLHRRTPPEGLLPLTSTVMGDMVGLAGDVYAALAEGYPAATDSPAAQALGRAVTAAHARLCDGPMVTCLRDFHAENIVPLPAREGVARLGLLDYQDAVLAHPAYDLVSALQDARRDVPAPIEAAERAHYAALTGADPARFAAAYALIGAQRNLRILGIFARLGITRGRPHYIALIPRVWGYLQRNLAHPELADLAAAVAAHLPEPTPDRLQRIIDQCPSPTP